MNDMKSALAGSENHDADAFPYRTYLTDKNEFALVEF
jgi:hypothetical protein